MSPGDYHKLPGDFRGFLRRNTLWLGPDHLLMVDSTRFSETYKRFYLPDIQTIVIRKTPRLVLPYYWIVIAVASLIFALVARPARPVLFWPAVAVLAAIVVYLYVASMFQSCTCHLITRVSKVELNSLFRLRSARQFVDQVTPRIIAAQGSLPEGWVERSFTLAESSTAADRNPDTLAPALPAGRFSWATVAIFVFVLIDAGITWLQLRTSDSRSLNIPNVINMIALAVCATISIVDLSRGKRRHKGGGALRMLVLAGLLVVAAALYGSVLLESFDQQFYHQTFENVLAYPGMRPLGIVEIILDTTVAIPGLILALSQSRGVTGVPPA